MPFSATAQNVTLEVVAPSSVDPGESFTASLVASVSPSAPIHAVAGFAIDIELLSDTAVVDSIASVTFPELPDGTRVTSVENDGITGIVSGQWANIAGSNPDLTTANPVVLCTFEVSVDANAAPGSTVELIAANPHALGGVFVFDASNPLQIISVPNDGSTSLSFVSSLTSVAAPCVADVNHDGFLTPTDFTAWLGAYNTQAPECDQNNDNVCNAFDFTAWITNYNQGC